jgi:polyhydroxybutyrate depolymerase
MWKWKKEMRPVKSCLQGVIAATWLATLVACTPTAFRFVAASTLTVTPGPTIQSGDYERTLTVNGLERNYLLHIPPDLKRDRPIPVVFVFHGFAESDAYARSTYGFDAFADASGFLVVYPNGTGSSQSWNVGMCCGYAVINNVDDAAFVRQILSDLGKILSIDPRRIYAAGFDNGAMLSYLLACEMSNTFAAIAPVAGVITDYAPCNPQQPVSLIHIHGLSDKVVPFAGGGFPGFGAEYSPAAYGIQTWVQLDGCLGSPQVVHEGIITQTVYASCRAGTAVELYTIEGLGHTWPSLNGVPAAKIIWDFFAGHPKE